MQLSNVMVDLGFGIVKLADLSVGLPYAISLQRNSYFQILKGIPPSILDRTLPSNFL